MKTATIAIIGLCAMTLAYRVLFADGPGAKPVAGQSPTTAPTTAQTLFPSITPSGDDGADLVVAFYKVLLQEGPPTLKQEKALFGPTPGLRKRFVVAGRGKTNAPILLNFLREHKKLFLPKTKKKQFMTNVVVSSSLHWIRDLDRMREAPNPKAFSQVLAMVNDDSKAKPEQMKSRMVVFTIMSGKIEVASILLDGFGSKSSLEVILDEVKIKNPPVDSWEFRPPRK